MTWSRVRYTPTVESVTESFAYDNEAERDAIDQSLRERGVPI